MKQRAIALVSMLCGIGLMGMVVSIQRDPLNWTSARGSVAAFPLPAETSTASPSQRKQPSPSSRDSFVLELPEVRIKSLKTVPEPSKKAAPDSLEPCSEWRDIGPAIVEDGTPLGVRRVRTLC